MRAMILAAGLGTRLRPITYEMPKPMVPVLNRPVMEHIVELLARHGFTEVIANLHWFPELIRERFGDGSRFGVELSYSDEEALLGTAGGVRKAADFLGEDFLVISGDALTDIDLAAMREFHASHEGIATLATKQVTDTSQFGVVITGSDGRVQGFQEKPDPAEALSNLANCGIYMFRAEIFDFFPDDGESKAAGSDDPPGFADWALDVMPALLEGDVPFYSHEADAYWNDIGNLGELWRSNMDAVSGEVDIDPGAPEVADGVRAGEGTDLAGVEVEPPALFGPGVELEADVRVDGPAVIGDGSRIGAGARIKESVLLPGTEVPLRRCWPAGSSPSAPPDASFARNSSLDSRHPCTMAGQGQHVDVVRQLLSLLAAPRCAACAASCPVEALLCPSCEASLDASPPPVPVRPPGVDAAWAAAPHEGMARELVVALKFRSLLPVAELIARRIAEGAPGHLLSGTVVPVPPAASRQLRRGFDPAEEIAAQLAALTRLPCRRCLERSDGPRQVGRSRAARIAAPPRVRALDGAPAIALLVDDVQTTGATLSACGRALRGAGAERVFAVTFARTL